MRRLLEGGVYLYFCSKMRRLFEGGVYSRATFNGMNTVSGWYLLPANRAEWS